MLFIVLNIAMNVIYFVVLGKTSVFYVFFINLLCTGLITFFFVPDMFRIQWKFDSQLLKVMFSYSWPILVLGIAGILNQVADKIIFPLVYPDEAQANVQLGIYGSCVKIAMIMAMITQAFRYAYEPIVFAKNKDADKTEYYATAMKYFIHGLDASTEIHHRRRLSRRTGRRAHCDDGRDLHGHLFQPLVLV